MKIAIVVEAIPPYCGGGEQVAWTQAVEMAKRHDVAVVTFGDVHDECIIDGVRTYRLPRKRYNLAAYATTHRSLLNRCLDRIAPTIIHCHMPHVLSACIDKKHRPLVMTIHDGVPENEMLKLKFRSRAPWLKFKLLRRANVVKADAITCVSQHNLEVMRALYPSHIAKFSFIPNPINERFLAPVRSSDEGYVLNFGRQIRLKMGPLLEAAQMMPDTRFVFVGSGEMVGNHGLSNVHFAGFSDNVTSFIDSAAVCVFPSVSENFPLVGLEAMARGKPVIATRRGFSEYIEHERNGLLLERTEPTAIRAAISDLLGSAELRARLGRAARATAEEFAPARVVGHYEELYRRLS